MSNKRLATCIVSHSDAVVSVDMSLKQAGLSVRQADLSEKSKHVEMGRCEYIDGNCFRFAMQPDVLVFGSSPRLT